jgi:hypothetical protein
MKRLAVLLAAVMVMGGESPAQWVQTAGPEGGAVTLLSVTSTNGHIFAGTRGGIYRSEDGGASWVWANDGIPGSYGVTALYADAGNVYAYGASPASLYQFYHSTDEGASWTLKSSSGLPTLASIACLAKNGTDLLAGVSGLLGGSGVYKSTDNGGSWTITSTGLPSTFYPGAFGLFGGSIYAGGHINATTKGAYRSTDGGANWSAVNTNFPSSAGVTAFAGIGSTVYASTLTGGVFKTTDNGANWTKISPSQPVLIVGATALAATASNLYIGTGGWIYKTDETATAWDTVTVGLPPRNAGTSTYALALSGSTLIASCSNLGAWRSTDGGASWTKACAGIRAAKMWGLMADGTSLYASGVETGFFRSGDDGNSWTEINAGVDLRNNGYYGFARSGSTLLGGSGIGAFQSSNGGDSWQLPSTDLTGPVYGMVVDAGSVYASGQGFVAQSTNGGVNWTTLSTGFSPIQAVFSLLKNGQIMLTATSTGGIKRSTDGGASWTATVSGLPAIGAYRALERIGTTYFIAYGGGVYRSTNDGANWSLSNAGVTGGASALHAVGTDLYVGTNQGIYRSTDLGSSWSGVNTGLPALPAVMAFASNGTFLFAGLDPNSVWRRPLSQLTDVASATPAPPGVFGLDQNYPNPFNPTTTIGFTVGSSPVRLAVYDLLGREVALLVDGEKSPGSHAVTWNAAGFPSGVYFCRLTSGTSSQSKRIVLMK